MRLTFVHTFGLMSMMAALGCLPARAAPPPSSFGVWDRGDNFDRSDYPFLKGLAFTQSWADVEKKPGVFDWSSLDLAMKKAVESSQFLYLSLNVGPDAPKWIYEQGVPAVKADSQMHDSWPVYPFYASPEYKTLCQRLITEFGKHIRACSKEMQQSIAFIQVKTGCTGDECAYKGNVIDKRYDLPMTSDAWREFRLWEFDLYIKTFQSPTDDPQIALMFNNVSPDDDAAEKKSFTKEWEWVMAKAQGGLGIKIAGSGRGHHLSGERSKIETWQHRLIAAQAPPCLPGLRWIRLGRVHGIS